MEVDRGLVVQWGVGRGGGSCDGQRRSEEQHADGRSHGSLRIKQRANGPLLALLLRTPQHLDVCPPPRSGSSSANQKVFKYNTESQY